VSEPLIQIVDEHDRPIGVASIEEAQNEGLIQQISRVMVEDENGNILLQKRAGHKRLFPNRWDNSVAGHVDEGEDYLKAAFREMEEEIGLNGVELQEIGYFYTSFMFNHMKLNQFQRIYKTVISQDTGFKLDPDEVSEVKWFTKAELRDLLATQSDSLTVGLAETLKRFYS
jgi:isopentenyldiphosphate isomerase